MGELSQIFYLVKILQRRNQIEASGCRKSLVAGRVSAETEAINPTTLKIQTYNLFIIESFYPNNMCSSYHGHIRLCHT